VALEFDYPAPELEAKIIIAETGIAAELAEKLVKFAQMSRNLKGNGLEEGASTRLLVHAAKLMKRGIQARVACRSAIAQALSDDVEILTALEELNSSLF
jgi:nitric oxide reductase NorQ protein